MLAREISPDWAPWTVAEILSVTGAGKSQSYQALGRLRQALLTLAGTSGRPARGARCEPAGSGVVYVIRDYLLEHPGACCGKGSRQTYSDGFRRFVVGLADPGQPGDGLTADELATECGVPLGTLKDWLRLRPEIIAQPAAGPNDARETAKNDAEESPIPGWIRATHLRLIATLWLS